MRKSLAILITVLFVSKAFAGASLKFSETVKNLGLIPQHTTFKWNVKVKNISTKPVTITKVKTTCGCTVAKPEKNTLLPGEEVEFLVNFNSEAFLGKIEKLIFIDTANGERYTLRIRAMVEKVVYVSPKRIKIKTTDDYLEQLVEIKTLKDNLYPEIEKVILPQKQGLSYELTDKKSFVLKAKPSKLKGGDYFVRIKLKKPKTELKVLLSVKVPKQYTVSPTDNLLFLNVKKGRNYKKTVKISSDKEFNILTKKSELPFIQINEVKKIDSKKWKVTLTLITSKLPGKSGKTILSLKTDNNEIRDIKLGIVYHIIK